MGSSSEWLKPGCLREAQVQHCENGCTDDDGPGYPVLESIVLVPQEKDMKPEVNNQKYIESPDKGAVIRAAGKLAVKEEEQGNMREHKYDMSDMVRE